MSDCLIHTNMKNRKKFSVTSCLRFPTGYEPYMVYSVIAPNGTVMCECRTETAAKRIAVLLSA